MAGQQIYAEAMDGITCREWSDLPPIVRLFWALVAIFQPSQPEGDQSISNSKG